MKVFGILILLFGYFYVWCNIKIYILYICIKYVKVERCFKGDFLIEWISFIFLGLNKYWLNICNYVIYKLWIFWDRVLLIFDRYYFWLLEIKIFYIDLLNKWRYCSLIKIVICYLVKEYIRFNYLEK